MRRYLVRRLLLSIPTFFGITLITFCLLQLSPDPVALEGDATISQTTTPEARAAIRRARGLDDPLPVRYGRWLVRVATLDFGRSTQDSRPVLEKIGEALPRTLLLSSLALFFAYLLAVPLGALAAAREGRAFDHAVTFGVFILYSLPSFWVAVTLLLVLCGGHPFAVFPLQGITSPNFESLSFVGKVADVAWHLAMPVSCLTYAAVALLTRHVRSGVLEVLRLDFIRTARAKGLSERAVLFRHALRNSLIPVITLLGLMIPTLIGGSVVVERVFGVPGMGLLAFDAILLRDEPMVMGITTLVALLTMVAMICSDLLYATVDPRIDLEAR